MMTSMLAIRGARLASTCAIAGILVLAAVGWLHAQSAAPAASQTPAGQQGKKPSPSQPAAPVILCPDGLPRVMQETPFGPMEGCPANRAATAPAQPETQPQTAAPAPHSVTTPPVAGATPAVPPATVQQPPAAEPAPTTPPPLKIEPSGPDGTVALNLENADLFQVLRIIGQELKINYIVDPAVKGSVTINTSGKVTRKDLFALLQMILEINGAVAVKSNGYYSIVPLANAKQQPTDFRYAKQAEAGAAAEEAFTLLVVPMKFMSAAEMSKILTPFMSPAGYIVVQDKGNIMLIDESAAKLTQLQEIINVFDDPVLGRSRVRLFPVTNNLATNLVSELKSVFAGYGLSSGTSAIQFLPMERLNSILAISPAPEVFPEVEEWIKKLDQPAREVGIRNFVYKVQNAKASDLRDILNELYGGQAPAPAAAQQPGAPLSGTQTPLNPATVMGPQAGTAQQQVQQPGGAVAPATAALTAENPNSTHVQGLLHIMSDDKNNALIIQATQHDYELLEHTLEELDVLPRQVLIDARIYEVDLTGDLSLGIEAFLDKKANQTPITTSGSFSGGSLQAQTFAILHNTYQLQMFLTADENHTRVKTLSAPSILVVDNSTARIQVGSEVPVPIGSALTPVQSGGTSIFAQTIQFRDVGVILTVTPRINAGGIVSLTVAQEVSSAQPNTTGVQGAPQISKSQFQTQVILRNGQTLALGGIISDSSNSSRSRVPLIGDIPYVGLLFGKTTLSTERKELVLLITPHVSQDIPESVAASEELMRRMKNLKKDLKKAVSNVPPQ
jgi:general secretion pathway protein D